MLVGEWLPAQHNKRTISLSPPERECILMRIGEFKEKLKKKKIHANFMLVLQVHRQLN